MKSFAGGISVDELRSYLEHCGHRVQQQEVETIMESLDSDGDGAISWEEFIGYYSTKYMKWNSSQTVDLQAAERTAVLEKQVSTDEYYSVDEHDTTDASQQGAEDVSMDISVGASERIRQETGAIAAAPENLARGATTEPSTSTEDAGPSDSARDNAMEAELRQTFRALDRDGNGYISAKEVCVSKTAHDQFPLSNCLNCACFHARHDKEEFSVSHK
jgi:hypothetical protein